MKKKICFITSSPYTANAFLAPHIHALSSRYEVHLLVNNLDDICVLNSKLPASVLHAPIQRKISPIRDLLALYSLLSVMMRERFWAVQSIAPKAGFLAMTSAWMIRVPIRVHIFTGQVWLTRHGFVRSLLRWIDWWIARVATHVLVDSSSQRDFLVAEGVVEIGKAQVLASGSVCGVDTTRFAPSSRARAIMRRELGIPTDATVLLYLGRLAPDKGVFDLARAFNQLTQEPALRDCHLLMVGPDDGAIASRIQEICGECNDRLHMVGYTQQPEVYMAASDLFVLPSYREGFGSVLIEAGSVGLPAVATRIYGVTDALDEGVTGLLYSPGEIAELILALKCLMLDDSLRQRMGNNARERVMRLFSTHRLCEAMLAFYQSLIEGGQGSLK